MKKEKEQIILKIIILLSILGLITSIYLVNNHYSPPSEGAFCDFGEDISCSLVNTSVYSELFNVPVALFGALWFVILLLMSWKAMKAGKEDNSLISGIAGWNVVGLLFVIYMIIAEIILKAICPACTFVHLIVIITFILSIVLYREQGIKTAKRQLLKTLKPWLVGIIILNLIPIIILNSLAGTKENYDDLAQCLTEKEISFYSSFGCVFCVKTKDMFGNSFQYISEVECHPAGENSQTEHCLAMKIEKTPTWILEPNGMEQKRHVGFLSIEELKEFSGCKE